MAKVDPKEITYEIAYDLNKQQAKEYLPVVNCRDCGITGWTSILNERSNATMTNLEAFYNRYFKENNEKIPEIKLHKMLYFAQIESIIQTRKPLFEEEFVAGKFGPVMPCIRAPYKSDQFNKKYTNDDLTPIMDSVFKTYSQTHPWVIAMISRGEFCYKKARKNIPIDEDSTNKIKTEDMFADAMRISLARKKAKTRTST